MAITDYIFDSVLVLLVLLQIKERPLTTSTLVRPLIIIGAAVAIYLNGIPTAGNDLVLVTVLALLGLVIGTASGRTVMVRRDANGEVLARSGWASAFFWVLGMGSRFAFLVWTSHGGAATIGQFSAQHSITSGEAWTAALLAMAVFEVGAAQVTERDPPRRVALAPLSRSPNPGLNLPARTLHPDAPRQSPPTHRHRDPPRRPGAHRVRRGEELSPAGYERTRAGGHRAVRDSGRRVVDLDDQA
jgi:hypothetical protein